jgi:aldehyde:ferredoxin oxidoreductase
MASFGYWKRLLRIDLATGKTAVEEIPEEIISKFMGAKGIGAHYFIKGLQRRIDPLSPQNRIILATGPFQGSNIQSSGRFAVVAKSPLTGIFLDTYCGGMFGPGLKRCGFDLMIIEGRSEEPVYISVTDNRAQIKCAKHLWGRSTAETEEIIKDKEGNTSRVVSIGVAGENKVLFSCLISDRRRAAGRGGAGAVFGSKNLKAVVANGTMAVPVADMKRIRTLNRQQVEAVKQMRKQGIDFYLYGTSWAVEHAHQSDRLPTLNFQKGEWRSYQGIDGRTIHREKAIKRNPCCKCAIACPGIINPEGKDRPEYETLAMLGANCGMNRYETVVKANELCNLYGLDTISTGSVIAFAMECSSRNIIEEHIQFGNKDNLISLIKRIALRQDIGDLLAQGTKRLADRWGHQSSSFSMNVKGLEMPAWNTRGKIGQGLAYMTADIGASHLRDGLTNEAIPDKSALGIVEELVTTQNQVVAIDNYVICYFATYTLTPDIFLDLYKAVTGRDINDKKIQEIGDRVFTLIRKFNCEEGISRKDDTLPPRAMKEPLPSGVAKGCRAFIHEEDMERCLDRYYELRGWDRNGVPKEETLEKLGIAHLFK